jgi:sortase (surface protein transpeptidase)
MGSLDARRLQLVMFGVLGAAALLAVVLMATGNIGGGDGIRMSAAERARQAAARSDGGGSGASAPVRQADSVAAFTKAHGDPPDATYGRIRIPAIAVNAPLTYRLVDGTQLPNPSGPGDVAYYDMSKWPGLGGVPGAGRNAIFGGHVDLNRDIPYANAHYEGPAVFWSLDQLRPGDVVEVAANGKTLKYAVVWVNEFPAGQETDWQQIWSGDVKKDSITLFTCGGTFDLAAHEYSRRVVVRAERT